MEKYLMPVPWVPFIESYGNKRDLEDVTNKETPSSSSHNFTFKKPKNDNFDNNYVLTELWFIVIDYCK